MAFFEEVVIADSIEIESTPERVFHFLTRIVDDESYRAWHGDHVSLRWLKGQPWAEGSIVRAEEYIHGKLHTLKFKVTRVLPNRRIEYVPESRFLRLFFPKNELVVEPKGQTCLFIASGRYRVGWIGKALFRKAVGKALSSVKRHMKEEGENLKKIVESGSSARTG